MVHVILFPMINVMYFYINTFRSICAVSNRGVFFFCKYLMSCCPGMLVRYFLNDCEMVSGTPFITGITSVFIFHIGRIHIVRSLYFRIFCVSFLTTALSYEIAVPFNNIFRLYYHVI
jgi:hypothetical protein